MRSPVWGASDFGLFGTASLLLHEWPPGMRQFRVMLSSLGVPGGVGMSGLCDVKCAG